MRIISGELKGRSIRFLKNSNTRPLKDTVKENIFNILQHSNLINIDIQNSNVLDLYSGIGSFGIECISKKEKKVIFIDKDKDATKILKENLLTLSLIKKSEVFVSEIEKVISSKLKEKFKIFFLDPPFKDLNYYKNLSFIKKNKLYEKKHIVIIHRERKLNEEITSLLKVIEIKNYGRSKIIFGVFN